MKKNLLIFEKYGKLIMAVALVVIFAIVLLFPGVTAKFDESLNVINRKIQITNKGLIDFNGFVFLEDRELKNKETYNVEMGVLNDKKYSSASYCTYNNKMINELYQSELDLSYGGVNSTCDEIELLNVTKLSKDKVYSLVGSAFVYRDEELVYSGQNYLTFMDASQKNEYTGNLKNRDNIYKDDNIVAFFEQGSYNDVVLVTMTPTNYDKILKENEINRKGYRLVAEKEKKEDGKIIYNYTLNYQFTENIDEEIEKKKEQDLLNSESDDLTNNLDQSSILSNYAQDQQGSYLDDASVWSSDNYYDNWLSNGEDSFYNNLNNSGETNEWGNITDGLNNSNNDNDGSLDLEFPGFDVTDPDVDVTDPGTGIGGDGTDECGIYEEECESDSPRLVLDTNGFAPTGSGIELHGYTTGQVDNIVVKIESVTSSSSIINGELQTDYSYNIVKNDRQKNVSKGKYDRTYKLSPNKLYALTLTTNGVTKIDRQLFNTVDIWLEYTLKSNSDVSQNAMELELRGLRNSDYVLYNSATIKLESTDGDTSDSFTVSRATLASGVSHLFTNLKANTEYYPTITSKTTSGEDVILGSLSTPIYTRASIPYFENLETSEHYVEKGQYQALDVALSSESGRISEMTITEIDGKGNDVRSETVTLQKKPGDNVYETYFYNSDVAGVHNYKIDDFIYYDNYDEILVNEYNGMSLTGNKNTLSNYVLKDIPNVEKTNDFISYNDVSLDLEFTDLDQSLIAGSGIAHIYEDGKKINQVNYSEEMNGIAISTCEQLSNIGGGASNIATYYLTSDLQCNSQIGDFYGKLYGNGHTIVYSGSDSLFSYIGETGLVEGLNLYIDIEVEESIASNIGGLVSVLDGEVNNVSVKGLIDTGTTSEFVGGISGRLNSTGSITNSYVNVDLLGGKSVGGITGANNHGEINTVYSIGSISGVLGVGGIVGNYTSTVDQGNVKNVYTAMNILAKDTTIKNNYGGIFGLVCSDYAGKTISGCDASYSSAYIWNGVKVNGFEKGNYEETSNNYFTSYISSSQLSSPSWYSSKGFNSENGFDIPADINVMFGPRIKETVTSFYGSKLELHNVATDKDFIIEFEMKFNRGDGNIETERIRVSTQTFSRKALEFIYNIDQLDSNATTLRIDMNQDICPEEQLPDLTDSDGDGVADSCDLTPYGEELDENQQEVVNSILNIVEYDSRTFLINSGIVELDKVEGGKYSLVDFTPYYSEYTIEHYQTGESINTCDDLQMINSNTTGTYYLNGNIDCSGTTFTTINKFEGVLFGNGYEIKNLTQPLININNGSIIGLGLVLDYDSSESIYGAIRTNNGIISKVYVSGNILTTGSNVGLLVGENIGSIENSYAKGNVTGYMNVGGLVGINKGTITSSFATGYISGSSNKLSTGYPTTCDELRGNVGGLLGCNEVTGSVEGYNYSLVSGEETEIGASIGYDLGTINNLYYTTPNDMSNYGAGIRVSDERVNDSNFYYKTLGFDSDIWTTTHNKGENYLGNTGPILKEELLKTYVEDGVSYYNASQLQYNTDYSWILDFNYMDNVGRVHSGSTERNVKTNILQEPSIMYEQIDSSNADELVFDLNVIDNDHTIVLEQKKSLYVENSNQAEYGTDWKIPGETITQVYIPISTCDQLSVMDNKSSNYSYRLINDIDCSGVNVKQIQGFSGTLNGYGYSITNLDMNTALFDQIDGTVHNIELSNVNINSSTLSDTGILAESNNGSINNLRISNASINGQNNVGGIVGTNGKNGRISDVNVNLSVEGKENVAGIAANNNGIIQNTQVSGTIKGENYVAGISSLNNNTITNSINESNITGGENVAGITAINNKNIDILENRGNIKGTKNIAGIVAENTVEFSNATNNGQIEGNENVGGIVAYSKAKLNNVLNYGTVRGGINSGGIVGYAENFEISKVTNNGVISGTENVGGIVGKSNGVIINARNNEAISGSENAGGIVGYNAAGKISRLINSANVSSSTKAGGIVGLNESQIELVKSTSGVSISSSGEYAGGIVGLQTKGSITDAENASNVSARNYAGGIAGGLVSSQNIANTNTINRFTVGNTVTLNATNVGGITGIVDNNSNKTSGSIIVKNGVVSAKISSGTNRGSLTGYYAGTDKTSNNRLLNPEKQPNITNITSNMENPFIGYLKDGVEGNLMDARNRTVSMYAMNIPIGGINQMRDNSSYVASSTSKSFMVGDMQSTLVDSKQVESGARKEDHHYSFVGYNHITGSYVDPLKGQDIYDKTGWTSFDNCVRRYNHNVCSPIIGANTWSTTYGIYSYSTASFYSPTDISKITYNSFLNKKGKRYNISATSMFQYTNKYSVVSSNTFNIITPSVTAPSIGTTNSGFSEFEQNGTRITIRNISKDRGSIIVRVYYDTGNGAIKSVEKTFEYTDIK